MSIANPKPPVGSHLLHEDLASSRKTAVPVLAHRGQYVLVAAPNGEHIRFHVLDDLRVRPLRGHAGRVWVTPRARLHETADQPQPVDHDQPA